ncbi:class I SAM-dependent methyltransferase [Agreia sp. VKM Ac-1783]|uniref:class I SAM-dependent methyltransferase n=1 Tax=Agreia sp. VKM Ac-1783 TaxID=1938889 RepID=UPI000A2AE9F7|nr:class I SAM-dependent methyltransferase [Agreia sp. VKM Ac-1783]SMQ68356.1 Methyltransferase domain-containing protein [Agreia sp. VKM Ac-1783]
MTHASHALHHSHPDRAKHGQAPEHHAELEEVLDLDARLGASVLSQAMDDAVQALATEPREIVDLGAGTGTGTVALAHRFGRARVHSIDASVGMLDRVREAAREAGVAERVQPHLADLDGEWTADLPDGIDMAWAALSLHHVEDPPRLLRQLFESLRPGGVLVVIEMTGETSYEPADLGTRRARLGNRIVDTLAARGYPVTADWTDALTSAGFAPVRRRETSVTASTETRDGSRYLEVQLAFNRALLAEGMDSDDLDAVDEVITQLGGGYSPLAVASGRVIWVAVRPDVAA